LINPHLEERKGSLTIELAIQADKNWRRSAPVILAVDDGQPCERLKIVQWTSTLIVQSRLRNSCQYDRARQIGIGDALLEGKSRFITITSDPKGTAAFIDGQLKDWRKGPSLLNHDEMISGRLVLGNSADGKRSWTGKLSTLAIYDQALSSGEVLQHFEAWHDKGSLPYPGNSSLLAFYRFDEKAGPIVKDHSGLGNDLILPERFAPLHRQTLTLPWEDFHASKSYAMDVAINILGFIPFGFYISWYLQERGIARLRVVMVVMALGTGTSFFIEILQAYLPARSSQLTDVLTNTGGTAVGIYLWSRYVHSVRRSARGH
jgi:hypothetical protein